MQKKNDIIISGGEQQSAHQQGGQPAPFSIVSLRERLMADVAGHINKVWESVDDDGRQSLIAIETILGSLFEVLEITEKTLDDAAAVVESQQIAVQMMKAQRDDAVAELERVVTAINDLDMTNPLVRQLYQAILAQLRSVRAG